MNFGQDLPKMNLLKCIRIDRYGQQVCSSVVLFLILNYILFKK